ncbi:unnamed protein product [Rangifer tarandus platyrhynchus]|uniref:Uncharacterized protein n=1 Tax=Rangifer tarandus platyrhynchus TaxID=3082113 RepID=A0ABN9A3M9_RANTA|nr:unnamed protein product [Rangifer tarandus platyrhynchus]
MRPGQSCRGGNGRQRAQELRPEPFGRGTRLGEGIESRGRRESGLCARSDDPGTCCRGPDPRPSSGRLRIPAVTSVFLGDGRGEGAVPRDGALFPEAPADASPEGPEPRSPRFVLLQRLSCREAASCSGNVQSYRISRQLADIKAAFQI